MTATTLIRAAERILTPPHPHGTSHHHTNHDCRCPHCQHAHDTAQRIRQHLITTGPHAGKVPAAGTTRRLQALHHERWDSRSIAQRVGADPSWICDLTRGDAHHVDPTTAERIALLYPPLIDTPGPNNRARIVAQRLNWPDQYAWCDDTIDDPTTTAWLADRDDPTYVDPVAVEPVIARKAPLSSLRRLNERQHVVTTVMARHNLTPGGAAHYLESSAQSINAVLSSLNPDKQRICPVCGDPVLYTLAASVLTYHPGACAEEGKRRWRERERQRDRARRAARKARRTAEAVAA